VFRDNGDYVPQRSSPTQALFGTICLWVAWFSFNAGSSQGLTDGGAAVASRAAVSTLLASGSGFLVALAWSWSRSRGQHIDVFDAATGLLAGLVAVTGACASIQPWEGFLIGGIGSLGALASGPALERLRVDDAVAVIPVHFVGGVIGTIMVGFFANDPALVPGGHNKEAGVFHGGSGQLLGVQALACVFVVAWSAGCFFIVAMAAEQCFGGLRVPTASQDKLDKLEHGIDNTGSRTSGSRGGGSSGSARARSSPRGAKVTPAADAKASTSSSAAVAAGTDVRERTARQAAEP
jgi:Amt family ammonium transporter